MTLLGDYSLVFSVVEARELLGVQSARFFMPAAEIPDGPAPAEELASNQGLSIAPPPRQKPKHCDDL
jgi:hypothetical protein